MIDQLRRRVRPHSLRARLLALIVAALAPLLGFAVAMVILSARSERAIFERGATERVRALITAVDAKLKSSISTLEALATLPQLDRADLRDFYNDAARILQSQAEWETMIVSDPSGESLLNLRRPLGTALGRVLEKRSFDQVVKTLKPAVGDVIFGPIPGKYGFVIRVPVMREKKLRYVLSAVIDTRSIDALLTPQLLPPNWIGVVLDTQRKFVWRTIEPQRSVGKPASDSLRAALDRAPEGWFRGITVEGWDVYTPYSRSEFSGWSVAFGIPAEVVDAGLRRSLVYLLLFGGGLLALGLLIAWGLAKRTAASIASLSLIAREVTAGKSSLAAAAAAADTPADRIAEVEDVREAFIRAHRLLGEQMEDKERIAARLQLALAAGNIGIYEWRPQAQELNWDDQVRAHWGLSPGTAVDLDIFRRGVHPNDRDRLRRVLKNALAFGSGGDYHIEFRVIGIEDRVERWIEARGQVFFEDGKAARLSGTTIDITQRKAFQTELERQVQERTSQLEETLGELEAFSYSVSHDMRAPLRAMEGYAKALRDDYRDRLDARGQEWLERIMRSAHRLDALVKDVLVYSRVAKDEIELEPVDLARLIEDIVSANPEFQTPRARVELEKPLHRVLGHEAYLTQCVTNLLGNAVKFVGTGTIPEVRIHSEAIDGKVRVWFEDNGIGIEPRHHERIFEIFGQVYPQGKYAGTGIGLAICRKAAQRMNGEIGVESGLGAGSRFWLLLHGAPREHSGAEFRREA